MSRHWHVHLMGNSKVPWALDEDLRQLKEALAPRAQFCSLPRARIVHAAWPASIAALPDAALRGKFVICQADNPPSFYLATREFAAAAKRVDLWVARSQEALCQFRLLQLPVALAPYCVDRSIFRPLSDRSQLRRSLGIMDDDFVIGNFHRDSEGADLTKPKRQKGPDVLLRIARDLKARVPALKVLLAGPRRHWLLDALRREDVPVIFVGKEPGEADDYPSNVLRRERLNELYQAMDCCVISSRWEGGPHAVLESLAAGVPVVGTPVGMVPDVLPPSCVFRTATEAVDLLSRHAKSRSLDNPCAAAAESCERSHGVESLRASLEKIYHPLPTGNAGFRSAVTTASALAAQKVRRTPAPPHPGIEALRAEVVQADAQNAPRESPWPWFPPEGSLEDLKNCAVHIAAVRGT